MNHTPGPWRAKHGFTGLNGCRIIGRNDLHVASITRKADKPIDQKQADLRLILAAPTMLAALKEIAAADAEELLDGCSEIWAKVNDAIGMAEGPPLSTPNRQG